MGAKYTAQRQLFLKNGKKDKDKKAEAIKLQGNENYLTF